MYNLYKYQHLKLQVLQIYTHIKEKKMENKTAMQELIHELTLVQSMTNMNFVLKIANDLLEKEKDQIITSVNDTINVFVAAGFSNIKATADTNLGELYYNEKFKTIEDEQSF